MIGSRIGSRTGIVLRYKVLLLNLHSIGHGYLPGSETQEY